MWYFYSMLVAAVVVVVFVCFVVVIIGDIDYDALGSIDLLSKNPGKHVHTPALHSELATH